jgi:hypothetical protein
VNPLRTAAPAAALVLVLIGCVRFGIRTGTVGDDVPSEAVRHLIDTRIGAPLAATKPALAVGKSVCPEHLDLSNGKRGRCTIPLRGAAMPVVVTSGREYETFTVVPAAVPFVTRDVEQYLRGTMLSEYGVESTVRCGDPPVRVLPPGAQVRCAIAGPGVRARSIVFKVIDASGHVFVYRLKAMPSIMDAFAPYLSAHKAGRTTIVPGSLIAAMIRRLGVGGVKSSGSDPAIFGAARCPSALDLTGGRIGRCVLPVAKRTLHYQAWIEEPNGITVRPMEAVIDTKRIRSIAVAQVDAKLRAAGISDTISVDCGPDRLMILEPESTFTCTTHTFSEGATRLMTVRVQDAEGHVTMTIGPKR